MVRVSILMSAHNSEKYIAEAIESILSQTYTDYEFIIIDDGSDDRTSAIINEYKKKDSRIVLIEHENKGLTASLNIGIQNSKGEFIARIDSDDIAMSTRIEEQVSFLDNNKNVGLVGTRYNELSENGKISPQRVKFFSESKELSLVIYHFNPVFHSSVMFRKDIVDQIGSYNEQYLCSQDYELWLRMSQITLIVNIDKALMTRRIAPDMISLSRQDIQLWYALLAKSKYLTKFDVAGWFYFFRDIVKFLLLKVRKIL